MKAYELSNVKKVYVMLSGSTVSLDDHCDGQRFALYSGIPDLDGGWMMETNGYPVDETALTDVYDVMDDSADFRAAQLSDIRDILNDPSAPWVSVNGEDIDYISDWLKECGF